ncbi:MAG: Obg family GTPase CgtA, partial [Pseudomonadota bacterium]
GPDGGDGGNGGSVIFEVDDRLNSLLNFQYTKKYFAENGKPGAGQHKQGKSGKDAVVKVPPGTLIKDQDENLIRDMGASGEFVFLKGGKGGKGNTYYKSSIQQAPEKAQKGLPGDERDLKLELKLMADIGLVGRPNAGKSTLISAISASKPKIADYPFTTLTPNLGVVRHGDFDSFVVADIPGLIRGASDGVGLGIQFLKHIERTRAFVHLVDVSEFNELEPVEAYKEIRAELIKYASETQANNDFEPLDKRPELVVLNKIDAVDDKRLDEVKMSFINEGIDFVLISAATRKGLEELVNRMAEFALSSSEEEIPGESL